MSKQGEKSPEDRLVELEVERRKREMAIQQKQETAKVWANYWTAIAGAIFAGAVLGPVLGIFLSARKEDIVAPILIALGGGIVVFCLYFLVEYGVSAAHEHRDGQSEG